MPFKFRLIFLSIVYYKIYRQPRPVILFAGDIVGGSIHSRGQSVHPLTEYTTENGLSLNSVNDLVFDKQGFLWVATADGLQRFDGYRFQTFRHNDQDKKSISENSISSIYEDENGNLWITHRTGISFKPKGKNEFKDITSAMAATDFRYPLTCVNETDSAVWVINYPSGIYAIDKISLKATEVCPFPAYKEPDRIYLLSRIVKRGEQSWFRRGLDKRGDLYCISDNGLTQFKNTSRIKVLFLIPKQKDSLVVISDKIIYKARANDPFTPLEILQTRFDPAGFENELMFMPKKILNEQYLLLGTGELLLYDTNKEDIMPFPYSEYLSRELARYLHTTATDTHQNTWLGFNGIGGIKVISLRKFSLFDRPVKNALTYSLSTDGRGKLFAGIYLGDIEVYDKEGRFLQTIKLPDAHKRIGSPRAMAMIDSFTLVVRSTLNELYAIDTRNGTLQLLSHLLPARSDSLFADFESGMQTAGKEEVWLSYSSNVLSLKKNKTGFGLTTVCILPVKEHITSLYYNHSGQLWIGTLAGAWFFEKNKLEKISLPLTYVKQINQQPNGRVWIATTNGIYILENKRLVKHLNTKDGLPNSFVYSILFDDAGNGWISTNRGLAKIDPAFKITVYSAKEGLQGDEFNTKGYCKGPDGTLYFAGVNGINYFEPEKLVSKSEPSQTMLTNIEVNNEAYLPNLQPEYIHTISLPNDQNNIRLSFSCMDFTVPEKNQYRFLLEGFQDDWTLPQSNNTVQYILPPGGYQLHVQSANYEGVWSREPLVLQINILPPWHQTTWARVIFAILILGAVATIFYLISRNKYRKKLRQLQMEQEVQKEKQRLSRDLHDNLGSQLTWLSNNISQLESGQQQQYPLEQKMNRLKEGAGELMSTLRETIWILNKDRINCIDLFDKAVSYAARYIELYPDMRLQTEEKISPELQLNSGQALQVFRICQEAITNACKYADASILAIHAQAANNYFTITINDNGKGFDLNANESTGHYGLQNMQQRADESRLDLNIHSSPGGGTRVTVSLIV